MEPHFFKMGVKCIGPEHPEPQQPVVTCSLYLIIRRNSTGKGTLADSDRHCYNVAVIQISGKNPGMVNFMKTIAVVGGGASGLAAALTAAEKPGRSVILLERQQRVGRKLLSTGNGRCNLSNTRTGLCHYHGASPDFAAAALDRFPPAETLTWFRQLGLLTVEEYGGRIYPMSQSANSVVDILRFACSRAGVELRTSAAVESIIRQGDRFLLSFGEEKLSADRVIIACGGAAGGKLGGVRDGYTLLSSLGHSRTGLFPALVQLTLDSEYPRALKGVRADAAVRVDTLDRILSESHGELQFTEKGVSGPAVFDVSRAVSTQGTKKIRFHANFFPGFARQEIVTMLRDKCLRYPELESAELFTGLLHNRLGRMLVRFAGLDAHVPLADLSEESCRRAVSAACDFCQPVRGTENFDSAQVTAGGIRTSEFDPHTMESRLVPGLFACGEVLDIDGDCGGYNLQWAWSSGRVAGRLGE